MDDHRKAARQGQSQASVLHLRGPLHSLQVMEMTGVGMGTGLATMTLMMLLIEACRAVCELFERKTIRN